jgi:hypothetical protein
MHKVRVKSDDESATLSLALYDDKDENGCFVINEKDVDTAASHGFYMWRPHHQHAANEAKENAAARAALKALTERAEAALQGQDAAVDEAMINAGVNIDEASPDSPQAKDGGGRAKLRRR